jgi:hypothetical protein
MSGLSTIKMSSEELKKEQDRQRKRTKLIFNTIKKGKIKVVTDGINHDLTHVYRYQIDNAFIRSYVDYTDGTVKGLVSCSYDDIDIFNQDGSEIQKLPLWAVNMIEEEIIKKFESFNIEIDFRYTDKDEKKSLIGEDL